MPSRTPTCLRNNPKVCPEDECPSRFLCNLKSWLDFYGDEYGSHMLEAIAAAERQFGRIE